MGENNEYRPTLEDQLKKANKPVADPKADRPTIEAQVEEREREKREDMFNDWALNRWGDLGESVLNEPPKSSSKKSGLRSLIERIWKRQ